MRLRPLLFVHPPFDFLDDEQVQDALVAGGVRDLMLGYWSIFDDRAEAGGPDWTGAETTGRFTRDYYATPRRGPLVAAFHPTEELYAGLGVILPDLPDGLDAKAERFQQTVARLAVKGVRVYTFGASDAPPRWLEETPTCINDPRQDGYVVARLQDYARHFPTIAGCVTDGPGYGYEITPGFRGGGQLFAPLCACRHCQARAESLGLDLAAMQAGADRLQARLHGLLPAQVDLFLESQAGIFDAIDLLYEEPALVDLLRFKTVSVETSIARVGRAIKAARPDLEYGICPRLPCFAPIQGCNFRHLSQVTDFIQSKHYLWMGGIDGFKGTLARYRQTLADWSPALDNARLEALICRLLGVRLPAEYGVDAFDRPAPKAFFDEVVHRESRKMLHRIGDAEKISPFLGLEHGGIWLTAEELRALLQAMTDAGLTRYTYYVLNTITDEVWDVMTEFTAAR